MCTQAQGRVIAKHFLLSHKSQISHFSNSNGSKKSKTVNLLQDPFWVSSTHGVGAFWPLALKTGIGEVAFPDTGKSVFQIIQSITQFKLGAWSS